MLRLCAVLVAAALFAPHAALASCGDWLAHPGGDTTPVQVDQAIDSPEVPISPKKCNGPLCRQSPLRPIPTPASPTSEGYHHETACLYRPGSLTESCEAFFFEDDRFHVPGGIASRIDRPPQA